MRNIKIINDNWLFSKEAKAAPAVLPTDWEQKNLPYTWNEKDGQDGGNDYYRGKCFFAKSLSKADLPEGEEIYLQFDGVNSTAEVFWNGKSLIVHHGGYSTFRVKLADIKDENLLVVSADNTANNYVYPQMADFTFYGGIYRDVSVIGVPKKHFDLDYYGAPGISVTPTVKGDNAEVVAKAYCDGKVRFEILDAGKVIFTLSVLFFLTEIRKSMNSAHVSAAVTSKLTPKRASSSTVRNILFVVYHAIRTESVSVTLFFPSITRKTWSLSKRLVQTQSVLHTISTHRYSMISATNTVW